MLTATALAKTNAKVLAKGALLKDGKTGYAQGTAAHPKTLSVMVQTTPAVKVKLQYSVICTKGGTTSADGANSSTTPVSGSMSVASPSTTKLKLPFASPTSCSLTVYTTLPKKGPKEILEILQT
ncbi:MAG TPA: hypothetical protein VG652_09795 [Gaiellaceae bacterium]|nr:hypothetical protein [Gaiellaceae bacterium]